MPSFSLPKLPYSYDALEPHIDTKTMEIHHTKHHQTYINNLNKTIEDTKFYTNSTLLDILQNVIEDQRETGKDLMKIRNNAGGHFNHSFFWLVMGPDSNVKDIKEPLMEAINTFFGSFDNLKQRFTEEGVSLFGSGFVWLCYDVISKQLIVSTSKDQDDPLMFEKGYIPMLTLDVWEHAYYLKYQNVRKNYIDAWWNVVNWKMVNMFYDEYAMKHVMVEIENDGTLKKKADE